MQKAAFIKQGNGYENFYYTIQLHITQINLLIIMYGRFKAENDVYLSSSILHNILAKNIKLCPNRKIY